MCLHSSVKSEDKCLLYEDILDPQISSLAKPQEHVVKPVLYFTLFPCADQRNNFSVAGVTNETKTTLEDHKKKQTSLLFMSVKHRPHLFEKDSGEGKGFSEDFHLKMKIQLLENKCKTCKYQQ